MRHIAALGPEKVPRDNEFKFRDRAKVLVEKYAFFALISPVFSRFRSDFGSTNPVFD
jgi:hypothetical protein